MRLNIPFIPKFWIIYRTTQHDQCGTLVKSPVLILVLHIPCLIWSARICSERCRAILTLVQRLISPNLFPTGKLIFTPPFLQGSSFKSCTSLTSSLNQWSPRSPHVIVSGRCRLETLMICHWTTAGRAQGLIYGIMVWIKAGLLELHKYSVRK